MKFILLAISVLCTSSLLASDVWLATHPSICEHDAEPGYKICLKREDVILFFFGTSSMEANLECLKAALSLGLKDECSTSF